MKRILSLLTMVGLLGLAPTLSQAQELLTNGGLNLLDEDGNPNPALYYSIPVGWTIDTDPCSYSPCSIVRYPGYPAFFAERDTPDDPDFDPVLPGRQEDPLNPRKGVVFNSTEGDYPGFPDVIFVDADLHQTVPGTPGQEYRMSGWAYFEGGYAGGVDTIATGTGTTREGLPSMTDTFFALEFLDAGNNVLPGSILDYELRANGQVNNPDPTEATRNWMQHVLYATAPAGTVSVRVRASMVDGEFNIDMPHQAAWVDDFSLTAVPEPTGAVLALIGLALVGAVRRKH